MVLTFSRFFVGTEILQIEVRALFYRSFVIGRLFWLGMARIVFRYFLSPATRFSNISFIRLDHLNNGVSKQARVDLGRGFPPISPSNLGSDSAPFGITEDFLYRFPEWKWIYVICFTFTNTANLKLFCCKKYVNTNEQLTTLKTRDGALGVFS